MLIRSTLLFALYFMGASHAGTEHQDLETPSKENPFSTLAFEKSLARFTESIPHTGFIAKECSIKYSRKCPPFKTRTWTISITESDNEAGTFTLMEDKMERTLSLLSIDLLPAYLDLECFDTAMGLAQLLTDHLAKERSFYTTLTYTQRIKDTRDALAEPPATVKAEPPTPEPLTPKVPLDRCSAEYFQFLLENIESVEAPLDPFEEEELLSPPQASNSRTGFNDYEKILFEAATRHRDTPETSNFPFRPAVARPVPNAPTPLEEQIQEDDRTQAEQKRHAGQKRKAEEEATQRPAKRSKN